MRLGTPEIAGFAMALKRKRMRELAHAAVTRFLVKARSLSQAIRSLSGGNQQKVAIAQALHRAPRLLLLEEPTRGVDIQQQARDLPAPPRTSPRRAMSVIMFCTEVLEVYEAADRAFVVAEGSSRARSASTNTPTSRASRPTSPASNGTTDAA